MKTYFISSSPALFTSKSEPVCVVLVVLLVPLATISIFPSVLPPTTHPAYHPLILHNIYPQVPGLSTMGDLSSLIFSLER